MVQWEFACSPHACVAAVFWLRMEETPRGPGLAFCTLMSIEQGDTVSTHAGTSSPSDACNISLMTETYQNIKDNLTLHLHGVFD